MPRDITAEYVRSILDYDVETGVFRWLPRKCRRNNLTPRFAGKIAGQVLPNGYRMIRIDGHGYYAHRLAWLFVNGVWPSSEIDHRYGQRDDNRLAEIRPATTSQNRMNARIRSDNTSGYKGVYWSTKADKWVASIGVNGRTIYIGCFDDLEAAATARAAKAKELHGEFARAS